jgi:hypothetical protein
VGNRPRISSDMPNASITPPSDRPIQTPPRRSFSAKTNTVGYRFVAGMDCSVVAKVSAGTPGRVAQDDGAGSHQMRLSFARQCCLIGATGCVVLAGAHVSASHR